MLSKYRFKGVLSVAAISLALGLAACSDSSTEIASPGSGGDNPGVPGGGNNGGGGNGGSAGNCPTGTTATEVGSETYCDLASGSITSDLTLTGDNIYHLTGPGNIFIGEPTDANGDGGTPVTLTIEAGAVLYADDPTTALVITRGSKIEANGTANDPIVFTSAGDLGLTTTTASLHPAASATEDAVTAQWGGIVINGLARINVPNEAGKDCSTAAAPCEKEGEGGSGLFGGANDDDSSGTLKYVQVRYSGYLVNAEDELNGVAFQGVGRGTTVDYVQVYNTADDCVEFFGGAVEVKHLMLTGCGDDGFDWTDGFTGKAQYVVIQQNPAMNLSDDPRGIEADNLEDNEDVLPRSHPMLSNFTIIGGASSDPAKSVGDTGLVWRRGTNVNLYNSVVVNWKKACLDVDSASTFAQLDGGNLTAQSTLMDCVTPTAEGDETGVTDSVDLSDWFLAQDNNLITANSLNGFINGTVENGMTAIDVAAVDAFFETPEHVGAVASADANWTAGWTKGVNEDTGCPAVDGVSENGDGDCVLEGTITDDIHLTAGRDYLLNGPVHIGVDSGADPAAPIAGADPAVLTIDAGTRILGMADTDAVLYITRGSQIFANGTKDAPIIFSSSDEDTADINTNTATWGGLQINGRAFINVPDTAGKDCSASAAAPCEKEGEGNSGKFGGNDDTDNSGTLRYVVIKYAGRLINATDELNGIAFQGVGSGTTIDYVQIHNATDDCMEFFGGNPQVKHVVLTGCADDSFDWTDGFHGKAQHVLVVQNPDLLPSEDPRGIEADNLEASEDALPRSAPMISNMTLVGAAPDYSAGNTGILFRRGTAATLVNSVATNFAIACFDIDSDSTYTQAADGKLTVQSTLLGCTKNLEDETEDTVDHDLNAVFTGGANNTLGTTLSLSAPAGGSHAYINGATEAGVTVTDPTAIDGFFDSVDHIGAVSEADDWTAGWTVWLHN
jgi:hypothetical protein